MSHTAPVGAAAACGTTVARPGSRPVLRRTLLLALMLAGGLLGACEEPPPLAITAADTALGVDADGLARNVTADFERGTDEIFVVLAVEGAPAGTRLNAVWTFEDDTVIAEGDLDLSAGSSRPHFSFPGPAEGWPSGRYRVAVTVEAPDGQQDAAQLPFRVRPDPSDGASDERLGAEPRADAGTDPPRRAPSDAPGAAGADVSALTPPEGFPEAFPLPAEPGRLFALPEEDGQVYAAQLVADLPQVLAFLDEALPEAGWEVLLRDEEWQDDDGVYLVALREDTTVLVILEPDVDTPEWTVLVIEVDPAF